MRTRHRLLLAVAVLVAPGANAGILSTSLTLDLSPLNGIPPMTFSSGVHPGGGASGTGGTAAWSIPVGAVPTGVFTGSLGIPAAPLSQLRVSLSGNPSAAFAAGSAAPMLLDARFDFLGYGGITFVTDAFPIGSPTQRVFPHVYGIGLTATANSWTTGTAAITLGSSVFTRMGTNAITSGVGVVTLVTGIVFTSNLLQPSPMPFFAELSVRYVPEPDGLLLGSLAVACLATGRRRWRAPRDGDS